MAWACEKWHILSQALSTIFGAIPSTSTRSGALNCDPQSFGATGLPISLQDPIPIVVNGALKRKDNEKIGAERPVKRVKLDSKKKRKGGGIAASKRKGDDDIDERKLAKRARTRHRKAQEGASKSANKQPASRPTTRRTRAGNR
ncbi:hypothetical protein DFH09DRAFT_1079608 [Mycena vulgaris]|nr:hypothetical protein DFH09DRAFT_1079608 [Mycena vulgaris]